MIVWIFNNYAVTPNLPGVTRHYDFAKELAKKGHKVTVFASSFHHRIRKETKEYGNKNAIIENFGHVRFVWLKTCPHYSENDWRRIVNMLSYAIRAYIVVKNANLEKPDVVIGSSVHLFAVYAAYLLSRRFKVPFVMEVGDLWPQTLIDMGIPAWNPFVVLLGTLERFLYRKAERIIILLPKANEYIESLGIPSDKIVWIPNGVDLERFDADSMKSFKKNNNSPYNFTIAYTGAIGRANNLDVVIEAADILQKDYSDIKFLFVGDGAEKPRLLRVVKNKSLNNVEFREPVPKDKIAGILSQSDALLFNLQIAPVFKYGISPNKLFDYLAAGKPIIFSCNSTNNPVDDAGAGITVSPANPREIADAVARLYKMPGEEKKKMGLNGRRYVEEHHSTKTLAEVLEKTLKQAIDSHCSS